MCGIVGGFSFGAGMPVEKTIVTPGSPWTRWGGGVWPSDDQRVVLGHRRLAVIETFGRPIHEGSEPPLGYYF
jgi:hypothetical protein